MQSLIAEGAVVGGDGLHHLDGDGEDRVSAPGLDVDYRLTRAHVTDAGADGLQREFRLSMR